MVCWPVGGKCVKGSCHRSTLINTRQSQSHPNINLGQYKQLFYQPKPSQTPLTEVQKIQYFDFFWNRSSDCDPPRLNWQLQPRPMGLKSPEFIWMDCVEAKDGIIKVERWPSLTPGPDLFLSLYRVKAKWSVGWSVANVSMEVVPDQLWSTLDSPRAIQTSIWANRNNFPINQNDPRHLWPKFKKSNILTFLKSLKWLWPPEAQLATST